jgi:F0F1-type ATP synthase assembly protein I
VPRERPQSGQNGQHKGRSSGSAESIAFTMLAGVVLGLLAGLGLDRLVGTSPAFLLIGVFVGFGLGLYAVFLETK